MNIHYYSQAEDLNNHNAQYNLGVIYEQGTLVPRDIDKAIHYYSLSTKHNDSRALYNLGVIYEKRILVSQDIEKAIHYYSIASKQNHLGSMIIYMIIIVKLFQQCQ
ncbi:hypothetical protein M9Y10_036029 [Tritrichomonas musculus]|uniref:Sel1 repeat family protein n=1 Tax=Tritrichomonas musculus TaxID=1915356 RepID=A0ABR2GVX0_9EUKA